MELREYLRIAMVLPFVLMILGLSLPLSALLVLTLTAGILAIFSESFVTRFPSIAEARMLRQARSRRTWIAGLALAILPIFLTLTIAPSLSSRDVMPHVAGLKPFSAETRYMSREGYLIFLVRRDYGRELSRPEARRIVARQRKGIATSKPVRDHRYASQDDPIRAKYGAAAEEYRLRTYHSRKTADRDVIPHQRKVVSPVNSKWSKRYDRVLQSSSPSDAERQLSGSRQDRNTPRPRPVVETQPRIGEGRHLYRLPQWCDSCRSWHSPGHSHLLHPRPLLHALPRYCTNCGSTAHRHCSETAGPRRPAIQPRRVPRDQPRPALRLGETHLPTPLPRSASVRGQRVLILPFAVETGAKQPAGRAEEEWLRQLVEQGYEVLPLPREFHRHDRYLGATPASYQALAERYGAEYVISGRVLRYRDYKRVSAGGALLGGLVTGVHGYGDVVLETTIFRHSDRQLLTDTAAERSKKQILGILGGTGDLLGLSLQRAVRRLSALL